jgi:hypothetical protein
MSFVTDRRISLLTWSLAFVFLALIFSRMMNFELRRDEQLYIPPAALISNHRLYSDFFYNHVPLSAWWFYLVKSVTGLQQVVISSRLAIFFVWIAFAIGLIAIGKALSNNRMAALLGMVFGLTNACLMNQTGMTASNNFMPVVLAFLGLGMFVLATRSDERSFFLMLLSGFFLSLAAATKVSAIVFVPITAITTLLMPQHIRLTERVTRNVVPLALGGIIGAIPVLFYLFTRTDDFIAQVIGFHTGPHQEYWMNRIATTDEQVAMALVSKLKMAASTWLTGNNLVILATIAALCIMMRKSLFAQTKQYRELTFLLICLVAAAGMGLVPSPGFPQYYVLVVAVLPLLFFALVNLVHSDQTRKTELLLIGATVISLGLSAPRLLQHTTQFQNTKAWSGIQTHAFGQTIAGEIKKAKLEGPVATFAPVYPLEGGLEVYPELATGPFAFRVASLLDKAQQLRLKTTSPEAISKLLTEKKPAAILVGLNEELEGPLEAFASENGYIPVSGIEFADRYGKARLLLRQKP